MAGIWSCVQFCCPCLLPDDHSSIAKEQEVNEAAHRAPLAPPAARESPYGNDQHASQKYQSPSNQQYPALNPEAAEFPPLSSGTQDGRSSGAQQHEFHGSYAQAAGQGLPSQSASQQQANTRPHYRVPEEQQQHFQKPHQEQHYGADIGERTETEPTEAELADVAAACQRLWELDTNRLTPGRDYELNVQDGKKMFQRGDAASDSLFQFVNHDAMAGPTFARFYVLLDNYNASERVQEDESREDRQEQHAFIEELYRTAPIKYLHRYLVQRGMASRAADEFKATLQRLWFGLYSRGGTQRSSSAFEHVFVGEVKDGREGREVSGFHNWIHFYAEESRGTIDYQGFILPRRRNTELPDSQSQLLTVQFSWRNILKESSSIFIGTSPEFEIALYTLCFFAGQENNHLQLGPCDVNVKVYRLGQDKIGSAFTTIDE